MNLFQSHAIIRISGMLRLGFVIDQQGLDVPNGRSFCQGPLALQNTVMRYPCAVQNSEMTPGDAVCAESGSIISCESTAGVAAGEDFGQLVPGDDCTAQSLECLEDAPRRAACGTSTPDDTDTPERDTIELDSNEPGEG